MLGVANLLMACSMLLLLELSGDAALYAAVMLTGLAYGGMNALSPAITSEIFGLTHMATIYPATSIALALGSIGLATQVSSHYMPPSPSLSLHPAVFTMLPAY